jgi:hypothetical protein
LREANGELVIGQIGNLCGQRLNRHIEIGGIELEKEIGMETG